MLNKVLSDLVRPVVVAPFPSKLDVPPTSICISVPGRIISHPAVILAEVTWASHLGHVRAYAARTGLDSRSSKRICGLVVAESTRKCISNDQTRSLASADRRRARLYVAD